MFKLAKCAATQRHIKGVMCVLYCFQPPVTCNFFFRSNRSAAVMTNFFLNRYFDFVVWVEGNLANCYNFPDWICRLGVRSPPAGVWHYILPLEDADLTFVNAPDSHSKRSASVQPGENSKQKEFSNFVKGFKQWITRFEMNTTLSVCCSLVAAALFWEEERQKNTIFMSSDWNILSIWSTGAAGPPAFVSRACP